MECDWSSDVCSSDLPVNRSTGKFLYMNTESLITINTDTTNQ